jgi:RHS repeat-associated protein
VDNGRTANYTYDAWSRLKTAATVGSTAYPAWGLSWSYDRYGNRKQQTVTAGSNMPSNSVTPSPTTNRITDAGYAYDLAGNMTNDGSNTLTYDAENRVTNSANGGSAGAYAFDGNSLRVQKTVSGATTVYVFSGSKVIAEYASGAPTSSPTREYIYSGSALLAKIEGSATRYYHPDHLSNRVTTDATGIAIEQMGHFSFGENWYDNGAEKWKFTSYERDAESGNDYALMRTSVNRLGRFSSPDPLAGSIFDPQSLNRYAYVLNNPILLIDPFGLDFCQWDDGKDDSPEDGGAKEAKCLVDGGTWVTTGGPNAGCSATMVGSGIQVNCPPPPGFPTFSSGVGNISGGGFWQRTKAVNQCAAQNATSLASLFHANPDKFLTKAFLQNDASTLSNLGLGPGRGEAASDLVISNPTDYNLVNLGVKAVAAIPTGGKVYVASGVVATQYGAAINMAPVSKTVGGAAGLGGQIAGKVLAALTAFKAVFDVGTYIYAEVSCAAK